MAENYVTNHFGNIRLVVLYDIIPVEANLRHILYLFYALSDFLCN